MMAKSLLAIALSAAVTLAAVPAHAAQQDEDQVQLSAEEVLVDVIVTDGKGNPITDLRADEIEVYEDGKRMEITSFGLVQTGAETNAVATGAPATRAPLVVEMSPFRGFNYIIVVVDRTSLNAQDLKATYDAGEKFVAEQLQPDDLVSVFVAGSRLVMLQNFTNNRERILHAFKNATDSGVQLPSIGVGDRLAQNASISGPSTDTSLPAAGAATGAGAGEAISSLNALSANINSTFDTLSGQFQAFAVVTDLLALMKVYSKIPGRKSVLLYSEGFAVDNAVERSFSSLLSTANRNNFAFYTVDAAGLRTNPPEARSIIPTGPTPPSSGIGGDRSLVRMGDSGLGRAERSVRTGGNSALHRLAVDTGGVPLRNSNDLNRGFKTVANDLQAYYALSYASGSPADDGKFREITVKVKRRDAEVRSRKGYFATPGGNNGLLLPFEQPVLAMLYEARSGRVQSDLPVIVKVERFRSGEMWATPIVMYAEASALEAAKPEGKVDESAPLEYELDAVAIIRDAKDQIVAKLSRSFLYQAQRADAERFKQLDLVNSFSEPPRLAPGTYKISVGVYDPNSGKGAVVERALLVPGARPGDPIISSLVLSREAVPVGAQETAQAATDPFVFEGNTRIIPNVTGRFSKAANDSLIAYFRFYGTPNKQYKAQVQFLKGGQLINSSQPADLPITSASGETAFAPTVPISGLEIGTYMIQVLVIDPDTSKPVANVTGNFRVEQ